MIAMLATIAALAWRPFLEPLDLHNQWLIFLPPLVIAIAIVYKALKMPAPQGFVGDVTRLAGYILFLMTLSAAALWITIELV